MKYLYLVFFILILSTSIFADEVDDYLNSVPVDRNDKDGLYFDYFNQYKEDSEQKAIAVSFNKKTKEINWGNYAWGVGFDAKTKEDAKEIALQECNSDKYDYEECRIIIVNDQLIKKLKNKKLKILDYSNIEKLYEILPIQDTTLYSDYYENYKTDFLNKAVAVTIEKKGKKFTWQDFSWGVGFDAGTEEDAKEIALEECNNHKYKNEKCIIIIVNNQIVHSKLKKIKTKKIKAIKAEKDFAALEKDFSDQCTAMLKTLYVSYPECVVQEAIIKEKEEKILIRKKLEDDEKKLKLLNEKLAYEEKLRKEEEKKRIIQEEKQRIKEKETAEWAQKALELAQQKARQLKVQKIKAEQKILELAQQKARQVEAQRINAILLERKLIEQYIIQESQKREQRKRNQNFWLNLGASSAIQPGESTMQTIFGIRATGKPRFREAAPQTQNLQTNCRFIKGWRNSIQGMRCY